MQIWKIGTWNVRGINNKEEELNKEFEENKWRILAITETKRKGEGVKELEGGNIMLYKGVSAQEVAAAGVGCLISREIKEHIASWEFVSERIMLVNVKTEIARSFIVAYGPNENERKETKDRFWRDLQSTVDIAENEVHILGDFNARVGNDNTGYEAVMGKWGEEVINANGCLLRDFCLTNDMIIGNSMFKHREIHKYTRVMESRNEKSIIDYIITRRESKKNLLDVKARRGPEIYSDHYLIEGKIKVGGGIHSKEKRKTKRREILKIHKLLNEDIRKAYGELVDEEMKKINLENENLEYLWSEFKNAIYTATKEACGTAVIRENKKQTSWWREDIRKAVKEKKEIWRRYLKNRNEQNYRSYKEIRKYCKELIISAKRQNWEEFGQKMENNKEGNHKLIYRVIKSKKKKKQLPLIQLKGKDGKLITDQDEVMNRWREHFEELLNIGKKTGVNEQVRQQTEDIQEEIQMEEVTEALGELKAGKAAGYDMIKAEQIKFLGEIGVKVLHRLINIIWKKKKIPKDWKTAVILPIYKKGDNKLCDNYRGISLLCTAEKIYEKILEKRVRVKMEETFHDAQSGFRKNHSAQDHNFTIRQVVEKSLAYKKAVYICFVDLEKAFDKVDRNEVWGILKSRKLEENLIEAIGSVYEDTTARVRTRNATSEEFQITTGLRQGGSLSPVLFLLLMDEIIKQTKEETKTITIGSYKLQPVQIAECIYADDLAIFARNERDLQHNLDIWKKILERKNLNINVDKTKVMVISKENASVSVHIDNKKVEQVTNYKYLGTIIEQSGSNEVEVNNRIGATNRLLQSIKNVVVKKKEITVKTKLKIYRTVYLPTLMYGSENWILDERQKSKLQAMEMRYLRLVRGITRRDRVRNKEVREHLNVEPLQVKIEKRKLRWFGHIVRMRESRQVKNIWNARPQGKRRRGRPMQTWNESVEKILRRGNIKWSEARKLAEDRESWKTVVHKIN